jgi:hypothetical protein
MGSAARVALYAPSALAPYVSLPSTFGGQTLYYSTTRISGTETWISTALKGYTPTSIGPFTTYSPAAPTSVVQLFPHSKPAPSTLAAAVSLNATVTPVPNGAWSGGASSSTNTPSTTTSQGPQTVTAPPSETHHVHESSGLSTGAKAGIGVGVAGGVIGIAALLGVMYLLRRRRNQNSKPELAGEPEHTFSDKSPGWQPGSAYHSPQPSYSEAYAYHGVPQVIHEAGSSAAEEDHVRKAISPPPPPMELPAESQAQEMDSGTPGGVKKP